MTIQDAENIVGGLSQPSKMPCLSFGISAKTCKTGSKLAKIENSVCSCCYALKGFYTYPSVKMAHQKRLKGIRNKFWAEAMALLIKSNSSNLFFRFFDSGDIVSYAFFEKIIKLVRLLPDFKFWLPTKEYSIISRWVKINGKLPENLTVRLSGYMVDEKGPEIIANKLGCVVSEVRTNNWDCPSSTQGGKCLTCRACWDKSVPVVSYKKH